MSKDNPQKIIDIDNAIQEASEAIEDQIEIFIGNHPSIDYTRNASLARTSFQDWDFTNKEKDKSFRTDLGKLYTDALDLVISNISRDKETSAKTSTENQFTETVKRQIVEKAMTTVLESGMPKSSLKDQVLYGIGQMYEDVAKWCDKTAEHIERFVKDIKQLSKSSKNEPIEVTAVSTEDKGYFRRKSKALKAKSEKFMRPLQLKQFEGLKASVKETIGDELESALSNNSQITRKRIKALEKRIISEMAQYQSGWNKLKAAVTKHLPIPNKKKPDQSRENNKGRNL